jgi:hypothetical protein
MNLSREGCQNPNAASKSAYTAPCTLNHNSIQDQSVLIRINELCRIGKNTPTKIAPCVQRDGLPFRDLTWANQNIEVVRHGGVSNLEKWENNTRTKQRPILSEKRVVYVRHMQKGGKEGQTPKQ